MKTELYKISVIIPVYNTADYLPRCLDSILNNTYKNLEIICINDGSPDHSLSILQDYAARDERILIIDQQNAGVSHARNEGLSKATGDYIAFIDSDDYIHVQYFEFLASAAAVHNADIVVSGFKETNTSEKSSIPYEQAPEFTELTYNHLRPAHSLRSYTWGKLYRNSILENQRYDCDMILFEDKAFAISLLCDHPSMKIVSTSSPLYYYYTRDNSASRIYNNEFYLQSLEHMFNKAKDNDSNVLFFDEVFRRSLFIYEIEFYSTKRKGKTHKKARDLIRSAYHKLKNNKNIGFKYRLVYGIFYHFPFIYHIVYSIRKAMR